MECIETCFFLYLQAGRNVRDLFEDLRDGHNLLSLLEVLSGEILVSGMFSYSTGIEPFPISMDIHSTEIIIVNIPYVPSGFG